MQPLEFRGVGIRPPEPEQSLGVNASQRQRNVTKTAGAVHFNGGDDHLVPEPLASSGASIGTEQLQPVRYELERNS